MSSSSASPGPSAVALDLRGRTGRAPGAADGAVEPYVLDLTDPDAAERAATAAPTF